MGPGRTLAVGFCHDRRATAALEFAILMPVYMLFLTGMMAYGIYFGAAHSVQQIAADAARTAIAGLTPSERANLVGQFINSNAGGYVFIKRSALTYSVGSNPGDPDEFSVAIHYDASRLPIWNLYPPLPLPSRTITFTSSIRMGGM